MLLSVRLLPATWPVESTQQLVYLALAGISLVVLFVRSRQDRQIGARAVNAIDLRGVTKSYGRTHALAGVDLAFDHGVTGLLGPNGAGKTTLLRIVATSIAADTRHGAPARPRPARLARRRHRHPPRARLPAPGARLSQRHDRLRLRGVRRRAEGVERPPAADPGGTPRARPGRPLRPVRQEGLASSPVARSDASGWPSR